MPAPADGCRSSVAGCSAGMGRYSCRRHPRPCSAGGDEGGGRRRYSSEQLLFLVACAAFYLLLEGEAYAPLGRMKVVAGNPVVTSIGESLGKTPAQVALRWGIQQGQSVLPKSANESRLKENIDLFGWCIPDELCAKFSEIGQALKLSSFLRKKKNLIRK